MPSNDSSPDETCVRCTHLGSAHDTKGCHPDPGRHECNCRGFVPTEPKGSTSSSPDKCPGLWAGRKHCFDHGVECCHCGADRPVPADAETAGEPEAHEHDWTEWGAVYHGGHLQWRDCRACGDHETRLPEPWPCGDCGAMVPAGQDWCRNCGDVKPEAPGCAHIREGGCCHGPGYCAHACGDAAPEPEAPDPLHDASPCDGCGHFVLDHIDGACKALYCLCGHDVPMPRPPFLVAYATGSGALNELALPGEASVAVVDGSLVISHASGVLGIAHVRPLEGP